MTAVRLPPVNAQVTAVRGPGLAEDYDTPAQAGTVKWDGTAPAYASEQVLVDTGQGRLDQHVVSRLTIPSYIDVQTGDEVTYVKGALTATRRVRNLEERSDFGFTRIYFYDA